MIKKGINNIFVTFYGKKENYEYTFDQYTLWKEHSQLLKILL